MAFIEWSDRYTVQVPTFDAQHKQLFLLIDQLHAAMKTGQSRDRMSAILNELARYTRTHFSAEENAMLSAGYSEFASHKAEHDKFTSKVERVNQEFEQGAAGLSIELMDFLTSWLQDHILNTDKKYSSVVMAQYA